MRVDLHAHTTASDGLLDPAVLCERAAAVGIELFCITDHDTLPAPLAPVDGLRLLAGIELSALWNGRVVHVLGLNLSNAPHGALAEGVLAQRLRRAERGHFIAERLRKRGVEGAYEGACSIAGDGVLGRPHFARFLVQRGAARTVEEAFRRWLSDALLGSGASAWTDLAAAVRWIVDDHGTAALAHPAKYHLTHTRLRELVQAFKDAGGTALEVACGSQTPATTRDLADLCRRYELAASAGSDYHGGPDDHARLGQTGVLPGDLIPIWSTW